jgi:hypothetical protein
MKRIEIEKKLQQYGVTVGDRIIVTERFAKGLMGQKGYTLAAYADHSLRLEDSGRNYIIFFNEIENVEPANV